MKRYKGIPPYQTTQKYVRWVLSRYYKQQQLALREARTRPPEDRERLAVVSSGAAPRGAGVGAPRSGRRQGQEAKPWIRSGW